MMKGDESDVRRAPAKVVAGVTGDSLVGVAELTKKVMVAGHP
jgi:hypothetical protein